jgi:malate/lactate dehydrogenase
MPRKVGRRGVLNEFEIEMDTQEQERIAKSVEALQTAKKRLDHSK